MNMNNKLNTVEKTLSQSSNYTLKQLIKEYILILRPQQWIKNVLVFAGLIFSFHFVYLSSVFYSLLAFITFCLLSGAVYIINDIVDVQEDRKHPQKKYRPLAAERIKMHHACIFFAVLISISFYLAWIVNIYFLSTAALYFALTIGYSLYFKNLVILDVLIIALGFLLRAVAGAIAINVYISPWFLFCTLLLSLFLALTKRRQESINLSSSSSIEHRKVLEHYSISYLDNLISIVTASTIIGYSLYTFTEGTSRLFMLTIPFVIYGIFRYLYLVHEKKLGEYAEEIILKDKPIIINILLWLILSVIILYIELEIGGMN